MSDERESNIEPVPDPALRAALADALGEQPADVDWAAMRARARSAALFRLRARARVAPWWEQVTPWATRLLPLGAVAAAAAVVFALATPRDASTAISPSTTVSYASEGGDSAGEGGAFAADPIAAAGVDPIAAAVAAPNGSGAVRRVAGPVDDDWLWNATAAAYAAEPR